MPFFTLAKLVYLAPSIPEELTPLLRLCSPAKIPLCSQQSPPLRPGSGPFPGKPVQRRAAWPPQRSLPPSSCSAFLLSSACWAQLYSRAACCTPRAGFRRVCFSLAGAPGQPSFGSSWAGLTELGICSGHGRLRIQSVPLRGRRRGLLPGHWGAADCSHLAMGYDSEVNLTDCLGTRFRLKRKEMVHSGMLRYATVPAFTGPKIWLFLGSPGSRQFNSSSQTQVLQQAGV